MVKSLRKWLKSLSYLDYLDKLLDEYNNTYDGSVGKKPIDANPFMCKIKSSNRENTIESFYEKELLLSKVQVIIQDSIVILNRRKVRVVLDFSSYASKEELKDTASDDTSNLAVKRDFITLKVEINDPTGLNNLKCKVYDLDVER